MANAKTGDIHAQNWIGTAYYHGKPVKQDYLKARHWFKQAAEAGEPTALRNLGHMYEHGLGGEVNYKRAKAYYQKAYKLGDKQSALNLGILYSDGLGVERNYATSISYLRKALNSGIQEARPALNLVTQLQEEEIKALEEKASKQYTSLMRLQCTNTIQSISNYGLKLPNFSGPAIDNDCVMETQRCAFRWSKGQIKIRNAFGSWRDVSVDCFTHNEQIVTLKINNVKVDY